MDITLSRGERSRFRDDLVRHRARSALNDAEYVREILRVSLNTFKKCVAPGRSLTMKRRVFNTIVANTGLDATRYGSDSAVAATPMNYGGYGKAEYAYIVGRYLIYRRHFQNGVEITRAVLDIDWSDVEACLVFTEYRRQKSESGKWQANDMHGHVYMHQERVIMGLLAIDNGDTRLTLLHIPSRTAHGTDLGLMRASGVVLTHGYPKRFYQPVVSPIAIEAIEPAKRSVSPNVLCATLSPDMRDYAAAAEDLRIAVEHAVVITPLMARHGGR